MQKQENVDFDTIRNSNDFKNISLTVPYLRLESSPSAQADAFDSVYNFSLNHAPNAQIFTIDSAQHEDFDCFSLVVKKAGNCTPDQRYNNALKMTVSFLQECMKNEHTFSKTVEERKASVKKK